MPYRLASGRRAHDRAYTCKRTEEGRQELMKLENRVLSEIAARPGVHDPCSLYWAFDQAYPFAQVEKVVEQLRGETSKGLIEYRRDGGEVKLWPRAIPNIPAIDVTPAVSQPVVA